MAKKLQFRRLLMLTLALAVAFVGLGYRLVDLQVLRHDELSQEAQSNTHYTYRLEPRRGDILDCKGNLLATSVFVKTVFADPTLVGNHQAEIAHAIAPLLQVNENELIQRLIPKVRQNTKGESVTNRYVVLKRKVPTDVWEKIRQTMDKLSFGVDERRVNKKEQAFYRDLREKAICTDPVDDQLRTYPNGALAAHVLGFTGTVERTNSAGVRSQEIMGRDGIELALDSKLKGVRGWRVTERDRQHHEVVALREEDVDAHDGMNAVLTIDSVIQHIAEVAAVEGMQKHSPAGISVMVVRPKTGEILALVSLPNYDPNNPGAMTDPGMGRDRVISDSMEPGSTFKIVVVSGALNDGTVKLTDQVDCEHGHFLFGGKVLHDHESYGMLSVEEVITHSSNIGAAKIGLQMGQDRLAEYIYNFGFGAKTGVQLPGESSGMIQRNAWTKFSSAQIPMGQGIGVTSLQLTMAMCAIANKGVLMRPMLVSALQDEEGKVVAKYSPQQVRRVIDADTNLMMIQALKTVVTAKGTAPEAAMEHYTVAGKTGTAQKSDKHGYTNKFYSSFCGFFPADNAEICIYVSLDDPKGGHYGGKTAAPIFKEIAEKAANYLNIRPDKGADASAQDGLPLVSTDLPPKTLPARTP
jgi:cell division protein FtsI/penicillin-binding protein 2